MQKKIFTVRFIAEAGIIAAVYFALTMAVAPIAFGQLQLRVSEALCVLPFFTPAAVPGLFVGCLLANIFSFLGIFDIVFGSLATLAAAFITYFIKNKWVLPFVVGALLYFIAGLPFWESSLYVGAGEAIACYALGMPLFLVLNKHKDKLFR